MAKHGYTVENHWFQGVCTGEHYAPVQKDRTATDRIVSQVRVDCDDMQQTVNSYREGRSHPTHISKPSYRRGVEDSTIAWEDADKWQQEDAIKTAIYRLEGHIRAGLAFADMLEQLANERHGQPLFEVEVETGPTPIGMGEKRKAPNGKVLKVVRLQGQRVYWKDERGFGSWTGSSAWRKYELA
jgi:hypothetical protein